MACHYYPRWIAAVWLVVAVVALALGSSCRRGVPVVDTAPKPPSAEGTIVGTVHGFSGTFPVGGRTVEIIDVSTGQRRTVQTNSAGAFSARIPAGKYRLELPLRDGETLLKQPDDVDLENGEVDAHLEFVLGAARVLRPRGPAYRLDNGLGSPIA